MRKKNFSSVWFLALFLLGLATACQNTEKAPEQQRNQIAQSPLARDTDPQVTDADFAAVVAGSTDFALKVFPLLDPSGNSNTVFSPYSITQAFALAAPGARGTTLSGIEQAMSFPLPQERLTKALNKLDLLLMSEATGSVSAAGFQLPILKNANAVWGQTGFSILPEYLDTLAVNYGAGLHLVDFSKATEVARLAINEWVEGQTNNRIVDLIPQGGVTSLTRVVLTNAVWFKANWASEFPVSGTVDRPFFNLDDTLFPVLFMNKTFTAPYAQSSGSQAVDIPYAGDKLSMLVIMPDPGTFGAFLSSLTPTVLDNITSNLAAREVALSLPKFTIIKGAIPGPLLRSFGMIDAFDAGSADFSGIDGARDLSISDVFHKAFIGVDEHGTEAAAATAIAMAGASAPAQPQTLTIDHPFIFIIRERQTGLILFMGKVVSLEGCT